MVIEQTVVITGSFNFTKANAEDLLWERHKGHTESGRLIATAVLYQSIFLR
jgi:hypothetical protein